MHLLITLHFASRRHSARGPEGKALKLTGSGRPPLEDEALFGAGSSKPPSHRPSTASRQPVGGSCRHSEGHARPTDKGSSPEAADFKHKPCRASLGSVSTRVLINNKNMLLVMGFFQKLMFPEKALCPPVRK